MNKQFIVILIALMLFPLAACGMGSKKSPESSASEKSSSAGESSADKAPDFSLTDISGNTLKLSDHKGKVVILDFWATWCPPCRAEIPFFIELQEDYGGEDFIMIGLAMDERSKVLSFAEENKINYPVAVVEGAKAKQISAAYGGVRGLPTTFVIDKNGIIQKKYVGFRPKSVFESDYEELKNK
ncbi:MAG: peroxiredoxin family protein [Candidatus Goldiibacteriota bacterium]